jgi:hypothetical protein
MTPLEKRLREIAERCNKPSKKQRDAGCCGTLLGHADIREVLAWRDAVKLQQTIPFEGNP